MRRAETFFESPVVTRPDTRGDYDEVRLVSYGPIDGRVFVCVWTPRAGHRRIINLRKANRREVRFYEQALKTITG